MGNISTHNFLAYSLTFSVKVTNIFAIGTEARAFHRHALLRFSNHRNHSLARIKKTEPRGTTRGRRTTCRISRGATSRISATRKTQERRESTRMSIARFTLGLAWEMWAA